VKQQVLAFLIGLTGIARAQEMITFTRDPLTLFAELVDNSESSWNKLDDPRGCFVDGDVLYVTSFSENALTIIGVSDPANPSLLAKLVDGADGFNQLDQAYSVFVLNGVAYVTAFGDDALTIIDVSDPAHPTLLKEVINGEGLFQRKFNELGGAISVYVRGDVAYV